MGYKYISFDSKGRVLVSRLSDGVKFAVTSVNLNSSTLQVGGSKTTYSLLLKLIGEGAAKELITYIVSETYKLGEC